jgi:hypothetical protein
MKETPEVHQQQGISNYVTRRKTNWRRGWDSNPCLAKGICKLHISDCRRCQSSHRCCCALPTIAHRRLARNISLTPSSGFGRRRADAASRLGEGCTFTRDDPAWQGPLVASPHPGSARLELPPLEHNRMLRKRSAGPPTNRRVASAVREARSRSAPDTH